MKYIAEIHNVREVCLVGSADIEFWKEYLARDELTPANIAGQAQLWLSAVQLKWLGITFREISVAIQLDLGKPAEQSIYLISAFNTSRIFAWFERNCFHTPYQHARVVVHGERPWSFELRCDETVSLEARSNGVISSTASDETWTGTIVLPATSARTGQKVFYAKLSGLVEFAPFDRLSDQIVFRPSSQHRVIQLLADSQFTGVEWRVRTNATHARSRTYNKA
jgi:hypothetical protein